MRYLIAFAVLASVIGVIVFAYEPSTAQDRRRNGSPNKRPWDDVFEEERVRIFEFSPVNPVTLPVEQYIWTPRDVYLVGDKIPLYVERVVVKEGPGGTVTVKPVSWRINTGFDTLKIKRGEWLVCFGPYPPEKNKSDYIPPIEEIDLSRLHGRLVFPTDEEGTFGIKSKNMVRCKVGDCFVTRLIDLTAGWCTKKAPDGRTLVRLIKWKPPVDGHIVFDGVWLDIRGVYKVQYEHSDIIEFEIR